MRWVHLVVLPLCLLFGQTARVPSQEKKQPNTLLAEVAGRSLEYWITQIPSKDQSKSEFAMRTVLLFGPDRAYQAVPAILDRLRKHPSTPVDLSVRVNGVIALGVILGGYKEADHKVVRDAVLILKRFLADSQNIVRLRAVQALGRLGTDAKEAIPEVINVVRDPLTFETRQAAATALAQIAYDKINGPSPPVLNALYGALGDNACLVRLAAIQSLTALGGPVNPAIRQNLVKALDPVAYKDPEPGVKMWAHMAIMSILRNVDKDRVDAIAPMVHNVDPNVRLQAVQALGTIGPAAKQTTPLLTKALLDPEATVAAWSMWALGRIGPAAGAALPALERIKMDPAQPEILKKLAQDAIDQIGGKKK